MQSAGDALPVLKGHCDWDAPEVIDCPLLGAYVLIESVDWLCFA